MPGYQFSKRAAADLLQIANYTERTWSTQQSEKYVAVLQQGCAMLAENPALGRVFDPERPDVRRIESGSHVIFYRKIQKEVLILRLLHKSMVARLHVI